MSTMTPSADGHAVHSSAAARGNTWFRIIWWAAALATGTLVLLATAGAAHAGDQRIAALSLAAIPDRATIEVRLPEEGPSDDLGVTIQIANHLAILLAERGYRPVDGVGELIVRFVAEEPTYASLEDEAENGFRKVGFERKRDMAAGDRDRLRLRLSVARETRPPLWSGVIERVARGREPLEVYLGMTDALMKHWGKTYDGH